MPNIAPKMAQHRANIGQHGANGRPRPNIGSTWAQDVPDIDHVGATWPNRGPRCAPDSLTLLKLNRHFVSVGHTSTAKAEHVLRDDLKEAFKRTSPSPSLWYT